MRYGKKDEREQRKLSASMLILTFFDPIMMLNHTKSEAGEYQLVSNFSFFINKYIYIF